MRIYSNFHNSPRKKQTNRTIVVLIGELFVYFSNTPEFFLNKSKQINTIRYDLSLDLDLIQLSLRISKKKQEISLFYPKCIYHRINVYKISHVLAFCSTLEKFNSNNTIDVYAFVNRNVCADTNDNELK